jgi:hypothetical protein
MSLILLLLYSLSASPGAGDCGRFPATDFRQSGNPEYRRSYSNPTYGYRVRLPDGITAYGERPPQPTHGVGIILSWEPRSYLYVDGSYNADDLADTAAVAARDEGYLRENFLEFRSVRRRLARLGGHWALRSTVVHTCGEGTVFVTDAIYLLERGIVYTIHLRTPASRYGDDKRVLDTIAGSFRLLPLR